MLHYGLVVFGGIIMWFNTWQSNGMSVQAALISRLSSGILFSLLMAFYYKYSANKNNLSDWHKL
jgi:hypothetical protein